MKRFKILFKWLVFVSYCVLVYLVMYRFPHEKAVPTHNQELVLSIGSIGAFVIVVVAIVIWELRGSRGRTVDSYNRSRKEALD